MAPNLFIAATKLVQPHKWFTNKKHDKDDEYRTEQWETPVPGVYEYVPNKGWALIATGKPAQKLDQPVPVQYSRALRRNFLITEYNARKRFGDITDKDGNTRKVGFFRLDDGVAYVNCFDETGDFIRGPYKMWCVDSLTGQFREMLKCDDPSRSSRQGSRTTSQAPSKRSVSSTRRSSLSESAKQAVDLAKVASKGKGTASRASSIAKEVPLSETSTRTSSVFDEFRSPRGSFKNLMLSDTSTTAPTSPSSSIRSPLDEPPPSHSSLRKPGN